ncbi:late embryogenesis abundant protein D-34-like [Lolium perenne]|uniref:late embryogenesis abundant protein D-34-like n=1 Tax=Lolium perenne TaxID=4522 RepID=UPI0021F669A7|nr:late embryogenesis abundant protein D-34-like [Lolium perenne]
MEQGQPRVDCQAYAQTMTSNQARVFEGPEKVTPRDADELNVERLAHVKIAEALEAAALAVGDHPVERSDAAAIRAAEARAVGPGATIPGGVAEQAEQAAESNATVEDDEDKVTIADVLKWNATAKLPTDKAVTREDAAAAVESPGEATKPYGVGAALTEAARHNQDESW